MESWPFFATLVGIGTAASFTTGLLGVGGGAYILPMLLYIPPMVGTGRIEIREATGLSIALVCMGSLVGAYVHRRSASPQCLRVLMPATGGGALVGGVASAWVPGPVLGQVFAVLALGAGASLLFRRGAGGEEPTRRPAGSFPALPAAVLGFAVGTVSGLVGAGGAFILVPLMITVLGVPTRVTIASSLPVAFVSSALGFAGKLAVGQVPLLQAAFLVSGALPGAAAGAWLSTHLGPGLLRRLLGFLTSAMALWLWFDLLR